MLICVKVYNAIEVGSIRSLSIECRYISIYKYHQNKTSFVDSQKSNYKADDLLGYSLSASKSFFDRIASFTNI